MPGRRFSVITSWEEFMRIMGIEHQHEAEAWIYEYNRRARMMDHVRFHPKLPIPFGRGGTE